MPQFRISMGDANCKNVEENDIVAQKICSIIQEKISHLKSMDFSSLKNISEEQTLEYQAFETMVLVTTYKKAVDSRSILFVVQAAYKTFKRPNYISFGFIGRILVEGILAHDNNKFTLPAENILWEYK